MDRFNQMKDNIFFLKFIIQTLLANSETINRLKDQGIYLLLIKHFLAMFTQFLQDYSDKANVIECDPEQLVDF